MASHTHPDLEKGAWFIRENARLLERRIFEFRFFGGAAERVLAALRAYQNADGGFGHALEPDLRASESQPLFAEFALRTLYDCGLRDQDNARRLCDDLARHADLDRGIPTLLPSSQGYPRANHWHNPASLQPSLDRLVGLVGLLNWQGIRHAWLEQAVEKCLQRIETTNFDDAHTLRTAFVLVESIAGDRDVKDLHARLAGELSSADYFCPEAPVDRYCLTPLDFAPTPGSYCRSLFNDAQIDAHLDDLQSKQAGDGGWPIAWEPPGEMARCEWRACKTLEALSTLRAYGRI